MLLMDTTVTPVLSASFSWVMPARDRKYRGRFPNVVLSFSMDGGFLSFGHPWY
jgi:hypothetical protein